MNRYQRKTAKLKKENAALKAENKRLQAEIRASQQVDIDSVAKKISCIFKNFSDKKEWYETTHPGKTLITRDEFLNRNAAAKPQHKG